MYVIQYFAPSGRAFVHVGTKYGIKALLKSELKGVPWKFLSRRKFDPNEKKETTESSVA